MTEGGKNVIISTLLLQNHDFCVKIGKFYVFEQTAVREVSFYLLIIKTGMKEGGTHFY